MFYRGEKGLLLVDVEAGTGNLVVHISTDDYTCCWSIAKTEIKRSILDAVKRSLGIFEQEAVKINIKKLHQDARAPTQGTELAAGFDLYATEDVTLIDGEPQKIPTGLAFEIPPGFCGVVYSRSSSALKGLVLTPLIVDADYRGEVFILARHIKFGEREYHIKKGDRIAQMKIERLESAEFVEADELSTTARGEGGYGSTGR